MTMKVALNASIVIPALAACLVLPQTGYSAETAQGAPDAPATASSRFHTEPLNGPDSADSIIRDERKPKDDVLDKNLLKQWSAWKAGIAKRTGFSFGADYTTVGLAASSSPGDDTAASGIVRIFGRWELLNVGGKNTGSVEFKFEDRSSYTDVPPAAFGFEVGYVGTTQPVFSDQGFRGTTLYWKQRFADDKAVARVGYLDVKEYVDLYGLASPWSHFHNLAFSVGSNTMLVLPDGAFGAMVGGYLKNNFYAAAGIVDRSGDPTDMFNSADTFFSDFDTFKTFEIGFTEGGKNLYLENAHVTLWQMDESEKTGAPKGWGVNVSLSDTFGDDKWLRFLRAAWADEGGSLYEASVSAGLGHKAKPGGNLLGLGINWGRPNSDTFPVDLDDQWTGEVFYRVQLAENVELTPSMQLLVNPALNPDKDAIAVFGLRARVIF